jgi:replicative DNA helicase
VSQIPYDDITTLEDQLLGMAVMRGQTYQTLAELDKVGFNPECFSSPHRVELLRQLRAHAEDLSRRADTPKIDLASICEHLQSRGVAILCGGLGYVSQLADNVGSVHNVAYYTERITQHAAQRQLITEARELLEAAQSGTVDPDTLAMEYSKRLAEIGIISNHEREETGADLASAVMWAVHNPGRSEPTYSTGMPDIDDLLGGGLALQRLYLIAGRPKHGKSALALNIARGMCQGGHRVHIDSLEMSSTKDGIEGCEQRQPGDLALKLSQMESGVPGQAILRGQHGLTRDQYASVRRAAFTLSEWPLTIDDTAARHYLQLFASIRRRKARHPDLKLVVIDYVGLIRGDKQTSRREIIGEVSAGLKILAKSLNIAILLLSQLNRDCERNADKRPTAANLKESGDLEQDTDALLLVQQPKMHRDLAIDTPEMWIRLDIHRHGPSGEVCLTFDGATQRIEPGAVLDPLKRASTSAKGNDQW